MASIHDTRHHRDGSNRRRLSCALVAARAQRAARADNNSIACQTKCPGRLLQRGWAPQERRSLAWVTGWQASIRHDDRRSRARWNVDGDHKSSIWFSTTDGARELVCADVALSGNHCELNPTGRTRGSRNKLSEEVICALLRDFRTAWAEGCSAL